MNSRKPIPVLPMLLPRCWGEQLAPELAPDRAGRHVINSDAKPNSAEIS
jgi:hypothetical protein